MRKILGGLFISLLFVSTLVPQKVFAQTAISGNVVILQQDQIINGDYFVGGQTVAIHGTVTGDLYVGGGNVVIDGIVNGDILAAGGTILLRGSSHNLRVAGGTVTVDSVVDGNVTAFGGNVTIANGAKITGSVVAGGGQVLMLAPTGKGATIAAGQVTVANTVNGNLLSAGTIALSPDAKVNGSFTYWSQQPATIENGAVISGKVTHNIPHHQSATKQSVPAAAGFLGISFGFMLIGLISSFVLGFLCIQFAPVFTQQITTTIQKQPWVSLGIGFIAAIAIPFIGMIIFITIVGIPLSILLMVLYGIYIYVSKVFVSLVIGMWIFTKSNVQKTHMVWALLVGIIIFEILGWIPLIGWLAGFVSWLMGMGALLITKRNVYSTLRSKKLI